MVYRVVEIAGQVKPETGLPRFRFPRVMTDHGRRLSEGR